MRRVAAASDGAATDGAAADGSSLLHRILVVEDEEAVAEGLRLLLEQEYSVDVASSGQQALELLLGGGPFDAVLCDLMMPGMSGIELFRALKARAPGMEQRLVFMTGGAFTTEAESFLDEVSNARVEKPFDFASVDRLLRVAVAANRRTDPARSDPARSDPSRSDPSRSDPSRSDPSRSDPSRSGPAGSGPAGSEPAR